LRTQTIWWTFVKKDWLIYVIGAFCVLFCGGLQVLLPYILGQGIDLMKGLPTTSFLQSLTKEKAFSLLFFSFLTGQFLLAIGRWGWRLTLARMTHYAGSHLREQIWKKACYFPGNLFQKLYTPGRLMNASTSDVHAARMVFGFTLVAVFDILFLGTLTLVLMSSIDVSITLWMLFLFVLLPPFIKKLSTKEMKLYQLAQESLSFFHEKCAHSISTIRLQRLTQTGDLWEKVLGKTAEDYRERRLSATFCSLQFIPTMGIGTVFSYLVLFGLGISKVLDGSLSLGDFVILQSYVLLLQEPILELGFIISEIQRAKTSLGRLGNIYQEKPQKNLIGKGEPTVIPTKGPIFNIKALTYKYPDAPLSLGPFNFTLFKNEKLGLMGPTGTGKSTLLHILLGLKTQFEGEALFLGKSVNVYEHTPLRQHLTMVSQDPFVFADTIRNNIQGANEKSDQDIWKVLDLVALRDEVEGFPDGLETPLGEWGLNLSGGQKQRLTMARAFIQKPSFLFLDDCLSSVDTLTEEKILKNMTSYLEDKTVIWVSHRKSTLRLCDRILEINHAAT
tara:strand:+ start:8995 stop:10671 length:1677 start_codon:yes stop_codon:yes gene_type:complete